MIIFFILFVTVFAPEGLRIEDDIFVMLLG